MRSTSSKNVQGSSYDRRRRKQFLLDKFGDGLKCACHKCGIRLTFETVTVDRIIPGVEGGTYRRNNIRPACAHCNYSDGGRLGAARLKAKRERNGREP